MKIATNVNRDAFGGITISNLALFDWLEDTKVTVVGVEIITTRHILGPVIFRRYKPSFFIHHIINGIDIIPQYPWEKLVNPRKRWKILIETAKEVLREEAPDIVLVNGTYFAPWILAQAAHDLGIPIVLRYAGVLQRETAHKGYFIRRRLLAHERWLASVATSIIFPSKLCERVVNSEVLKLQHKSSFVIPNPVKAGAQYAKRKTGRFSIAAVGRWSAIKNFQSFIALHEQLTQEKWPHRAIIVTPRWDKKFSIPETIERRDPMSQEELKKFYRSIDLLVVPSNFETFCNVAAEALVSGTAVLVSKQIGFSEILRKAGLQRMVIDSFSDPVKVGRTVKRVVEEGLSSKEQATVARLVDPHMIHKKIIHVLSEILK
jgi:glycosyltransferase involved in cell wall biosynthesis